MNDKFEQIDQPLEFLTNYFQGICLIYDFNSNLLGFVCVIVEGLIACTVNASEVPFSFTHDARSYIETRLVQVYLRRRPTALNQFHLHSTITVEI